MAAGTMSLNEAIDFAVKDFLNQGINCITYSDGRRVNIADYVRMALRTTSTRATLQGKSKAYHDMGYDTVIISQYSMCSDTCLPYQGKVYIDDVFTVWEGEKSDNIAKSNYCGKWFPLLSSAIRGGLFHPNCRHSMELWIEGHSTMPEPIDNAKTSQRYKAEQKQRELERKIRKCKRLVVGLSDPKAVKDAKKQLKLLINQLENHINANSFLRRDFEREKIYDNIQPAPPTNTENILTNPPESGIIKSNNTPKTLENYDSAKVEYMEKIKDSILMNPENKNMIETTMKRMIDEGDFCMRIEENVLKIIADSDDGRFKSQMETGTSNGAYNPKLRKEITEKLFGADSSKIPDNSFEKYGFLTNKDKSISYKVDEAGIYGGIIIQFNKKNIFDRTTFIIGDSLNIESPMFASKVSEPSVCAVPFDEFTEKVIKACKNFNGNISNFCEDAMVDYIELQYHGELTLDDVETIYYQGNIDERLKKKLKELGISFEEVKDFYESC